MAKIGVIELNSDTPSTYIKKSAAQLLVRRLLAVWVNMSTIRRVHVSGPRSTTGRFQIAVKAYIPEELPAAEIPGVRFVLAKTCNYQPEVSL